MHVAVFNYSSSGLFHYAVSLVNALTDLPQISRVTFFTSSVNSTMLVRSHPNIHVRAQPISHYLSSIMRWSMSPHIYRIIQQEWRDYPPDVIHVTDTLPLYLGLWSTMRNYPMVYTQHDSHTHAGDRFRVWTQLLQRYLRHMSDGVVVHGEALRRELVQTTRYPADKITTIPIGDFSILLTCSHGGHVRLPRSILFFGRIVHYKGLDILLKALINLQNEGEDFHFILAGPGDILVYRPLLDQLHNLEITNRFIPDGDVHMYFAESSMVVLPYREATQSAVAALALSAGLPVVATTVGALPELLKQEQNSLLVPPHNVDALQQAIRQLLNDKKLYNRLAQGAKQSAQTLSWKTVAKHYVNIYQSVL